MKAYMMHQGEPWEGAALVFARSHREARTLAFRHASVCDGCDYTDVRGRRLKNGSWLREHAADQDKLAAGIPHVIDTPPSCERCQLWGDEIVDGYCVSCAEDIEYENAGGEQ